MESIADWANEQILDLWDKYSCQPECKIKEVPLLFYELKRHSLLFVGINPSSSEQGHRRIERKSNRPDGDIRPVLVWKGTENVALRHLMEFERDAWEHYDYYSKFREMAEKLDVNWSHIDLFFYRMLNQQEFKKVILDKNELKPFGKDQLNLATKIIEKIEPKAIVVANAFACDILRQNFPYFQKELDPDFGCYYFQGNGGKGIPTFFTSMLTGRRALDKGSLERLIWQIGWVLNKLK